jgi:Potential Monad-binding region of RPAP3
LFAAFTQELKFTAFTKLFRSRVDPEFVTAVLASLACVGDTVPAGSDDSKACADTIHKFVGALTKTPSFDMTTMMFTSAEKKGEELRSWRCLGHL